MTISDEMLQHLRNNLLLDWNGVHGVSHWARVRFNGLQLAKLTRANDKMVELFAFLHDSQSQSDGADDVSRNLLGTRMSTIPTSGSTRESKGQRASIH